MTCDKRSFILGMVTAFCECVAGGCKRLALSPPLTEADYAMVRDDALTIIEDHGLLHHHERNLDLPESQRFQWIVIAARQATLDEYLNLRAAGHSPARSLKPFHGVLSYDPSQGVHTGRDTYLELFPLGE